MSKKSTSTALEIRKAALEAVQKHTGSTKGAGRLQGKVGIITGVGPPLGIGTASAKLFAREGSAHLYLLDYADTHLSALQRSLQQAYPAVKVTTLRADAADHQAISDLVNRVIAEEGHLDYFFANAGILHPRPTGKVGQPLEELLSTVRRMKDVGEEEYREVMRINALSVFIALKYASEAMGRTCPTKGKPIPGGSIILTASVAGIRANAGPIAYSASKAAVISMAQTSAYELMGQNIRVNAICPGLIQTDMTKAAFALAESAGKLDRMGVLNPMLRQGIGAEVGHMALFLASDDSSYVNGQALVVDGGLSASHPYVRAKM